jgi:Acyl-CoA dehydrogenase, C-terminal domain
VPGRRGDRARGRPGAFTDSALTALALARSGRPALLPGLASGRLKASWAHHGRIAWAATYYAAMALDAAVADAPAAASAAKAFTGDGIATLAGEALQTHAGIGFTWEHELHRCLRRAKADEMLYGSAAEHHERLVTLTESALAERRGVTVPARPAPASPRTRSRPPGRHRTRTRA